MSNPFFTPSTLPFGMPPFAEIRDEHDREAFDAEISEFVAAIEEKRAPSVGFEDGRLALVLAEAALKSITEGRVVAVKEVA